MQIVFLCGSGGTERVWEYQSRHFPAAIAVTLPGHPVLAEYPQQVNAVIDEFLDNLYRAPDKSV